jgi:nicotinamide-nucleotide amidase
MRELVEKISGKLENLSLMLVTAESCTGGMIAAAITDRPGSSAVFERGFITYSNQAKTEMLGVSPDILREHGAVSARAAIAMAHGALNNSRADVSLSVTGIAGPGGGTPEKPVGLVYIGYGFKEENLVECSEHRFDGDRASVRRQSAEAALKHLLKFLDNLA